MGKLIGKDVIYGLWGSNQNMIKKIEEVENGVIYQRQAEDLCFFTKDSNLIIVTINKGVLSYNIENDHI